MTVSSGEIQVEVTVPAPDPEPETPETPAVVVVEAPPAETGPGDGVLAALLSIESRLAQLENAVIQTADVAVTADIKATHALEADAAIQEEIQILETEVTEALEEDQAPAESDAEPARKHWLHR